MECDASGDQMVMQNMQNCEQQKGISICTYNMKLLIYNYQHHTQQLCFKISIFFV